MGELDSFVEDDSEGESTVDETAESQPVIEDEGVTPEVEKDQKQEISEDQGVEEGEPPAPLDKTDDKPEPVMVPLAAKQAEKERRMRAEQELEAFRQQQAAQPDPDAYVEPDKAIQHAVGQVRSEMMAMFRSNSEAAARAKHDDFDEKMEVFSQMAQQQPQLMQQLTNSFDAGEFVYQTAKTYSDMQEVGNLDEYKENLRTSLRAELLAEMEANKPELSAPTDLSSVRTTGGDPVTEIADGDDGLMQLLGK